MKVPVRGPGRPRKWKGPTDIITLRLPLEIIKIIDDIAAETGKSRTDVIVSFVRSASNVQVTKLLLRIDSLEEAVERLEKEKQALLDEREKLLSRIESLELENQALKQGRSVRSYQDARMLKVLAEKAREGVSWKALCAEVLGLRDENKIKKLLRLAFVVRKDQHNRFPDRFYPKDIAEEFHGWILVRSEKGVVDIIDYVLYREDTLKAAKGLVVGKKGRIPEVRPLKRGAAAERWIEIFFDVVRRDYMAFIKQKRGKDAVKYLEEEVPPKLERVLQEIDPEEWRRAILAVLEKHEGEWNEAFVSNLRRVIMRTLSTTNLEVKADV